MLAHYFLFKKLSTTNIIMNSFNLKKNLENQTRNYK